MAKVIPQGWTLGRKLGEDKINIHANAGLISLANLSTEEMLRRVSSMRKLCHELKVLGYSTARETTQEWFLQTYTQILGANFLLNSALY